jgi:hypothetical protein
VFAVNAAGMSDPGSVTVYDPAPPAIIATGIEMEIGANSITVNSVEMEEDPDATGFVIVRGTTFNFSPAQAVDMRVIELGALPYTLDGLNHNSAQYLRIAAKDSFYDAFGGESGLNFTSVLQVSTADGDVWNDAPIITYPAQNQANVEFSGVPVDVEPVMSPGNAAAGLQVQLSLTQDFRATSYDSGMAPWSGGAFTTTPVNMLTTYYVRARVRDKNNVVSGWSVPVKFKTSFYPVGEVITFTESGVFTVPAMGLWQLEAAGGGGGSLKPFSGSSSLAQPGGAGGYAKSINIFLNKNATLTCTVGNGGAKSRTQAGSGGTSSIGGYLSATGGTGGYVTYFDYLGEERMTSVAGSPGNGSGGNSVNQAGGGGSGGVGGNTYNDGSPGWVKFTYLGQEQTS